MATVNEYLSQADHNAQVAGLLSDASNGRAPRSLQWAVVCAFYSGVHYVNAYLERTHISLPANHGERQQKISEHMSRNVSAAFKELQTWGYNARYELAQPTPIDYQRLSQHLDTIRTDCRQ